VCLSNYLFNMDAKPLDSYQLFMRAHSANSNMPAVGNLRKFTSFS